MPNVIQCHPLHPPIASERGSATPSYKARWFVEVDEDLPSPLVRELAAAASGSGIISMPAHGSSLDYTSAAGTNYVDSNALALDFEPDLRWQEDLHQWEFEVTWRPPDPSRGETPGSLTLPPIEWEPTYQIFYDRITQPLHEAVLVTDENAGTLGSIETMQNSAGHPLPPVERSHLLPVLHIFNNVASPVDGLNRNAAYEDSVNSTSFSVLGRTIQPHHALYDVAEVGDLQYANGVPYRRMVTRIKLGRFPFYTYRFNEGPFFKSVASGGVFEIVTDDSGNLISPPFPLKTNGDLATSPADHNDRVYLTHQLADFGPLVA